MRSTKPAGTPDIGELLTIEQAAQRINMSARFVRRLVDERRIAVHRFGRAVRINPADLFEFVNASRVEPITRASVWNDLGRAA